jgi:hypothetical protein
MSHQFKIKTHGYGYEGIYNFISEKNGCVKHTSVQIGDYQGDAMACFIRKDGMVGMLDHAYGSCSGCDDYQACWADYDQENEALIELANDYEKRVRWDTSENTLKRCEEIWLEGQAGYHIDKQGFEKWYRKTAPSFIKKNIK